MELSEKVKLYRREHKYSLREFADLCGLSHVQIYRIEKGTKTDGKPFEPLLSTLKKLAAGMGMSLDEILIYCEHVKIRLTPEDLEYKPPKDRQEVIDKIILATPEQFAMIKSYVDFVMK